jgi:hypothetical protein
MDFTLQAGSTAIGAAAVKSSYFTVDKAGVIRGVAWDIGAYEYGVDNNYPSVKLGTGAVLKLGTGAGFKIE